MCQLLYLITDSYITVLVCLMWLLPAHGASATVPDCGNSVVLAHTIGILFLTTKYLVSFLG